MREKGLIATKAAQTSSDAQRSGRDSIASPLQMIGEAHLPGEVTNPDEQLYQFVNKNNLALTQHSIRDVLQEVSMEIEISIDARSKNIQEIDGWIREAVDEQKRLMLKRS